MTDADGLWIPAAELEERDERLARRIALLTAQQFAPGTGSMILPPAITGRMAFWQPMVHRQIAYAVGGDFLELEARVLPSKRAIELVLDFNGQHRVWTGLLRP